MSDDPNVPDPTPPDPSADQTSSEPLSRAIGERYLTYALSTIMNRALPEDVYRAAEAAEVECEQKGCHRRDCNGIICRHSIDAAVLAAGGEKEKKP